jgi:hypothetical protein
MILFRMELLLHGAFMLSHVRQAALDGLAGPLDNADTEMSIFSY